MGCKAIRRERARKVALEGQGAPDTAQRGILLGVNEGGTTQSAASFGARRSAFFYSFRLPSAANLRRFHRLNPPQAATISNVPLGGRYDLRTVVRMPKGRN